mmetsp:Transcript_22120/g.62196  ORF Transcript_22120/g.62196 Transcript_22120/m.62196 type:complete len:244 (-) Transcript_22120:599-1330(-)
MDGCPSGNRANTSGGLPEPMRGGSPVDAMPAAPVILSCNTSRSCVSSCKSRSIWSISWSSRSNTASSFSDSRSSAWICDTRFSAFSWDRCKASISSCCLSNATLDSSMSRSPSFNLSGPGSAFSQSRRLCVRRRPRWPRYTLSISRAATMCTLNNWNSSLVTFMRQAACILQALSALNRKCSRRARSMLATCRPRQPRYHRCISAIAARSRFILAISRPNMPLTMRWICVAEAPSTRFLVSSS